MGGDNAGPTSGGRRRLIASKTHREIAEGGGREAGEDQNDL